MGLWNTLFGEPAPKKQPPKKYKGYDIREVWDWRLSKGNPILFCDGPTWVIRIFANDGGGLMTEHVTDYPTKGTIEDYTDYETIAKCYEWLRTVRDDHSRRNLEELKPKVARINEINKRLSEAYKA